jgi:myo-inositol-1(or 4)-monophosphatase
MSALAELTDELLDVAVEAARMAGGMLLERFESGEAREVSTKSTPTDLVSEADISSERAIHELLGRRRPQDGLFGEEGDDHAGESGLRWIVDPLDGTVNFLWGLPQWSVSVAVADAAGTVAGVIYDPCRDQLFTAAREGEPSVSTGGRAPERLRSSECADLSTALIATGFAYDAQVRAAQAELVVRVLPRVRDIRRFGSAALDLAWTAWGRYDGYFEHGIKLWDVAAGALICERAGLRVLDLQPDRRLPKGILVAPEGLLEPLRELVGAA